MHHFSIVVLLVLDFAKFQKPVEERGLSLLAFSHHRTQALIAYIENETDDLVGEVEGAPTEQNMFVLKLECGWVFIELEAPMVLAFVRVFPFELATQKLHKLRVAQTRVPCLVLCVLA